MDARRVRLILGTILVVAFALRLGYVVAQRGDVLFDHPVLDEDEYVKAAHSLVEGHADPRPYWQPPGIIYTLAATFEVTNNLWLPRLIQILISVASCGLVFLIGRRLFDPRIGLVAAAITAVHGVLVFECYELLPATWIVFWDLLALWLLLRAIASPALPGEAAPPNGGAELIASPALPGEAAPPNGGAELIAHRRPLDAFATGLAIGVSAIFSPTILPFALVAAVLIRKPPAIAALVLGVVLPIAPVTYHNHRLGEVVLVSANGGLNFYLGNNADYEHTFAMRPGREWERLSSEPLRNGILGPGAQSTYFEHRTLSFVRAHPGEEALLLARKTYLFVHGAEIPRDTDIYAARSGVLAALIAPRPLDLPDGLLVPIGLAAIVVLWRERSRLAAPLWLLVTIAVTTIVFFVSARHRAPALPLFALFAAAGAFRIAQWPRRSRLIAIAGTAALAVVTNIPTWETSLSYAGEADFYRGLAATDPETARAAFTRATELAPDDPRAWFELGNRLEGHAAVAAWQHAAELDPNDPTARRRMVETLARLGDLDGAITALRASPKLHAPDHMNLAFMLAQRGRTDEGIAELHAASAADENYVRTHVHGLIDSARTNATIAPAFIAALEELDR
jgi:4-amino-4-deoxy-L-arabinose transferase-like glycosyltransferase